jgi:hypothetical protein
MQKNRHTYRCRTADLLRTLRIAGVPRDPAGERSEPVEVVLVIVVVLVVVSLLAIDYLGHRRLFLRTRGGGPVRPYPTSGTFGGTGGNDEDAQ